MRTLLAISTIMLLGACSLYQSAGRKFLEQQAFEFSGAAAQAHLVGCGQPTVGGSWMKMSQTPAATVYAHETGDFEMRVLPTESEHFACDYRFSSAQEMYEKTNAAIDLTVANLHAQSK